MSEIFIYIYHPFKYPNPTTFKVDLNMKFSNAIKKLYKEHPIFYENNIKVIINGQSIPLFSTKTIKELGLKYYSKLKIISDDINLLDKEEKEKFIKMKEEMFERQKNERSAKYDDKKPIKEKINQVLEDMCLYGKIMSQEIFEETKKNPEKFIKVEDAEKMEETDKELFSLSLLANILKNNGTNTVIEKDDEKNENENEELTCMQFLSNGMINKKKYELHFNFDSKKNIKIINNKDEFEKFKNKLKKKLSKKIKISEDEIIVAFPQKGSVRVQLIFQSDVFHYLEMEEFKKEFQNDPDFKDLNNLKEIHEDCIMSACKLKRKQLDPRGNRYEGWGENEKRGGLDYNPPKGYIGIGLKVLDKYPPDDIWIGMTNIPGEWCVAYHGIGRHKNNSDKVKKIVGLISKTTVKKGGIQVHEDCDDIYHKGKKVGIGAYITPLIETAEEYAGICHINGKKYKVIMMVRVNPSAIRGCSCYTDYWVVNGTPDEIRPYRILYKLCNN